MSGLREAAEAVVEWAGPCEQFDHHGNCQSHAVEKPCRVAALQAALNHEPTPAAPLSVERLAALLFEESNGLLDAHDAGWLAGGLVARLSEPAPAPAAQEPEGGAR